MGCYPLFCCQDWSQLHADIEDLGDDLVSLSLVTDPFGAYDVAYLQQCFKDVVIPFKEHYVIDLHRPMDEITGKRRRKHARRALREVQVEVGQAPVAYLDEWTALYGNLIRKHEIRGIRTFSKAAFATQFGIPGAVMLRAVRDGIVVGAQVYFVQDDVVHCHLGASSEDGYAVGVTYALDWVSIETFADKARWLNLGGGAGTETDGTDGLSEYKRGWATDTRTVYFCGRILNPQRYAEIVQAKGLAPTSYFPAYRAGEFG